MSLFPKKSEDRSTPKMLNMGRSLVTQWKQQWS